MENAPVSPTQSNPLPRQNVDHDPSRASTLELTLITLALFSLMLITLQPSARKSSQTHRGQLPATVGLWLIVASLFAYMLTTTALALGWMRLISLDALVTIVFPLTASLLQVPIDTISDYLLRSLLRRKWEFNEYLRLNQKNFAYVKVGYECGQDSHSRVWDSNFDGQCLLNKCKARLFIYRLPQVQYSFSNVRWFMSAMRHRLKHKLMSVLHQHGDHSCDCSHEQEYEAASHEHTRRQWDGVRIGHTRNAVELQVTRFGGTFRVWNAVSSGSWLIQKPWMLYLENQDQVLEGLSLITEIIAFGDLVLFLRREYVMDELRAGKGGLKRWHSQSGQTGVIHRSFIEQLHLVDWKPRNFRRSASGGYNSAENLSRLFFVLIRKSRHLKARIARRPFEPRARSAHRLVDELRHSRARDFGAFERELHALVDEWLVSWGCEREKLNRARRATLGRLQWPSPAHMSDST